MLLASCVQQGVVGIDWHFGARITKCSCGVWKRRVCVSAWSCECVGYCMRDCVDMQVCGLLYA